MEQDRKQKWVLNSVYNFLLALICIVFQVNSVFATSGLGQQTFSEEKDLVQLRAGTHVMAFQPNKVYLVNSVGFLSVDFLYSNSVSPLVTTNNLKQSNASRMQENENDMLASLQRVEYPEIWDGISLHYDGLPDGIAESTYFIQPGANVSDIRLHYNNKAELQKDGSLKIILPNQQGYIIESKPVAWQVINGRKEAVKVAYEIQGQVISYRTDAYNKNHELIIDPTYQWHSFFGSAVNDGGGINSIAVDDSGNVYVTGVSSSTWDGPGFSPPLNAFNGTDDDIVIIKLDSNGAYQWHTFFGCTDRDRAYGLALDSDDNVYISGSSNTTWDGPGAASPLNAFGTNEEIVVIKLNSSGVYQWHTFYGSTWYEKGRSIAIDGSNNVYVTGETVYAWNGPGDVAPVNPHGGDSHDIVIIKLNRNGVYQWHTFHGAPHDNDGAFGIAVDTNDNIYVTGYSLLTWDGPGSASPLNAFSNNNVYSEEIVVIKLNSSGVYQWHTFYGAADVNDRGHGLAVDSSNNVYVTGVSKATWDGPSGESPVNGSGQAVVIKLDNAGTYQWHTFHGSGVYSDNAIAIDGSDNIYVTVASLDWNGPAGENPLHAFTSGIGDITDNMVFKLDSNGAYRWHTFCGAADQTDVGDGIAIDGSNNIYVGGYSNATWEGPEATAPLNPYTGDYDIVVFALNGQSVLTLNKTGLGTVASNPVGINCGGDCSEIYNDGTNVTLTATTQPDTDFEFFKWTGDCSGTNPITMVKVDGDKTCVATFRGPFPWNLFLPSIINNSQ